jgi:iron-sulfur cluster assembly accessory protein|tara:strand:+ start:61 stop:390 length:330 start_codon:yes stop_codon:yes gene_type:complete
MNPIVNISKRAGIQLINIAKSHNTDILSFSIKGGGCNGYNYIIEPLSLNDKLAEKIKITDKISMEVCSKSMIHILGTNIDWEKTIMGETFTFKNPMAKGTCGCGTSFSI